MNVKLIANVNGFQIVRRLVGEGSYYQAKKGMTVFTSKDFNYILRKVEGR